MAGSSLKNVLPKCPLESLIERLTWWINQVGKSG